MRLAVECDCWWRGNVICLSWKILITLGRNVDRKGALPKIIFISVLNNELWHICKSLLPSAKGQSIYFHVIYFSCWVNFLFQPTSISWQASCGGERSRHIWPVKYIWSWLIIVDNYLYDKWVLRRNINPLSFYVCSKNMIWVLAIIEDYMMIEYVELLLRLCWE